MFFGALGGIFGFKLSESGGEWDIKSNKHVKRDAAIEEAQTQLSTNRPHGGAVSNLRRTYRPRNGPSLLQCRPGRIANICYVRG